MKNSKNSLVAACLAAMMLTGTAFAQQKPKADTAPVAGTASAVLGVTVEEVMMVARGWSIKKHVLGKNVYNDANEKLGKVEDVLVTPDKALSYAIIGASGFLGVGKHDVAIPINQLRFENDRFILPGATKDALKAMPKFEYAK
jgi:sporulation protein YlmC with PRC-barrel domain